MRASSGAYRHAVGRRSAAARGRAGTVPLASARARPARLADPDCSTLPLVTLPMHIPPMPQLVGIILPGGGRGAPREYANRRARGGSGHGDRFARKAICLARKPRNPGRKAFCLARNAKSLASNVVGPCTQRFLARAQSYFGSRQAKKSRARGSRALRARFNALRMAEKPPHAKLRGWSATVCGSRSGQKALRGEVKIGRVSSNPLASDCDAAMIPLAAGLHPQGKIAQAAPTTAIRQLGGASESSVVSQGVPPKPCGTDVR